MPVGARVGTGALAAALAVGAAGLALPVVLALLAAATAGVVVGRAVGGPSAGRGLGAVLVGAWLVAARLLLDAGASQPPPAALPDGSGPWTARVDAIGTPRDGTQRLTVALDEPPGVVVAVSAPRYPAVEPGDRVRFDGAPGRAAHGRVRRLPAPDGRGRDGALALARAARRCRRSGEPPRAGPAGRRRRPGPRPARACRRPCRGHPHRAARSRRPGAGGRLHDDRPVARRGDLRLEHRPGGRPRRRPAAPGAPGARGRA